ncbi:MAG: tRNA (N(6)-L-threonylcarbamoyladenosine(37)-C(2))-methylthiotransferase MtaB [Planctomycetota bacterium]
MPTLKTLTLGCKVNQYETEYLRQGLKRLGYRDAVGDEAVDLCLVNTCTVTAEAESKSRKAIRHLHKAFPGAEIVVMGCYATRTANDVAAIPGVAEVITDKRELPGWLERRGLHEVPTGIDSFSSRHRAYVKIQDGCTMSCSYCIVPRVRPILASRPLPEILDEVRRLVEHGHREIVLTGIHLGHYGVDLPEPRVDLAQVVQAVAELPGQFRIRLSSIEAHEVGDSLLAAMAKHASRVCPHLHLPLQSGADPVLERMRRRWPVELFEERCKAAHRRLPGVALTTDVMVGFPGETEADFLTTCRVVERIGFSKLHVFRFSPREGTPAADMPNPVPPAVQRRRAAEMGELGERLRLQFFHTQIGTATEVLVESVDRTQSDVVVGTCRHYLPFELPGTADDIGRLIAVRPTEVRGGMVAAERVS